MFIKQHPHVSDYPHRCSPFAPDTIAQQQLNEQHLDLDALPNGRVVWNFFNRPQFDPIKQALAGSLNAASQQQEQLDNQIRHCVEDAALLDRQQRGLRWWTAASLLLTLPLLLLSALLGFPEWQLFPTLAGQVAEYRQPHLVLLTAALTLVAVASTPDLAAKSIQSTPACPCHGE